MDRILVKIYCNLVCRVGWSEADDLVAALKCLPCLVPQFKVNAKTTELVRLKLPDIYGAGGGTSMRSTLVRGLRLDHPPSLGMPAPALSYGLNVVKKPSLASRLAAQPKRKTIFDDDDNNDGGGGEDEEGSAEAAEAIDTFDDTLAPIREAIGEAPQHLASRKTKPPVEAHRNVDLSSAHSANKAAAQAHELDPSVYDYDAVYDSLHAKPATSKGGSGPKYMASLMAAAEVRKKDQLQAKEKILAKEREAEGEEFADKEKFVTGAYRAQQEENRRLEAEERERERKEAERKRRLGGGMTGLYKGLLEREEARHDAIARAAELGAGKGEVEEGKEVKEKSEAELAKEKGAVVNEDGQVVDKRELLQAGLNVKAKPKPSGAAMDEARRSTPGQSVGLMSERNGAKAAMRARQSKMLEEQLAEAAKRAAQDEEVEQEAQQRAAKSKKTEGEISSARERYLQRKREAEAAEAAGEEP